MGNCSATADAVHNLQFSKINDLFLADLSEVWRIWKSDGLEQDSLT